MRYRILTTCAALLFCTNAGAQPLPVNVVLQGATAGLELSDGEPISFFLEHSRFLKLTDDQRTSLIDIRRWVRRVNAPFMNQIDSLRQLLGISLEPRRLDDEDVRALSRLDSLSKPFVDSMKSNNDAATREARALLQAAQVVTLDSLLALRQAARGRRPPPQSR
jgi:hypothetical protein